MCRSVLSAPRIGSSVHSLLYHREGERNLLSSFYIWKINICGHSGTQTIVVAGQTNLHPKHLFDPVRDSLYVARCKLGLAIYLLDDALEIRVRKRIDTDADVLA